MSSPSSGDKLVHLCDTSGQRLSTAVCAGVQQKMEMSLSRLSWSSRTLIRATRLLMVTGLMERVANSFTQWSLSETRL